MTTKGIRIYIRENKKNGITLFDVLKNIPNGDSLSWDLLFIDGVMNPGQKISFKELQLRINESSKGLLIDWKDFLDFSSKFFQIYELLALGSQKVSLLHRYESSQAMYENCDIVVELIDCVFWEVYAQDKKIISSLEENFSKTELIY